MGCENCRVPKDAKKLSLRRIKEVISLVKQFAGSYLNVVLSGGEPLLYDEFFKLIKVLSEAGCENVTLLTNGALFTEKHLTELANNLKHVNIIVSLDSVYRSKNDGMKNFVNAFEKATAAMKMINEAYLANVVCLLKMLVTRKNIAEMKDMVSHAQLVGCNGIIFSSVIPSSRDQLDHAHFKQFVTNAGELQKKYAFNRVFRVWCNEPLLRQTDPLSNFSCPAGITSINVTVDGVTPCPFLPIYLNISSPEEYKGAMFIRMLLEGKLKGDCELCLRKSQLGLTCCRARALLEDDLFGPDPYCEILKPQY